MNCSFQPQKAQTICLLLTDQCTIQLGHYKGAESAALTLLTLRAAKSLKSSNIDVTIITVYTGVIDKNPSIIINTMAS